MSTDESAIVRRQRLDAYLASIPFRPRSPTKDELRAMAAEAMRNTAHLPIVEPLPPFAHGKTRSEQGGSSA
jgi:hypothetical protein